MLNNAIMPIEEHAEQGVRPTPDCQGYSQEETIVARPARLATTNVTDWKQEQKEDPILYQEEGPLGTSGLPRRRILLMSPDSIGDVRVGAMSSTLRIWKSKS